MELNLKNGTFRRCSHDLNNIFTNLKKAIEEDINLINSKLPINNRIKPVFLLFKDDDFKETEGYSNIPNIAYFVFNLNKRTNSSTNIKDFHTTNVLKPQRYDSEIGPVYITPKANTISVKVFCKTTKLLFIILELIEDIFTIKPEKVINYKPLFSIDIKNIKATDEQFHAIEFLITCETQHVFKEFDREIWLASIVEDFTENLIDEI